MSSEAKLQHVISITKLPKRSLAHQGDLVNRQPLPPATLRHDVLLKNFMVFVTSGASKSAVRRLVAAE